MKAILLDRPDARPVLSTDLPVPAPCADEILIRVQASSVNPVDNAIANGMFKGIFEHEFPITLGRDYAGTVEHAGADVDRLSNTDEVFGFIPPARPVVRDGAWSELVVVPESLVAHRPGNVDLATAGAAPLAASTAMTAVDALALSPEDTVLIMGATGGVGSFAVQLAAAAGATVIAPAQPEDHRYLRRLGVDELLPRDGDVVAAVRARHPNGVDALLDLVSQQPGKYDAALRDNARVVSTNRAAGEGPGRTSVQGIPSRENLERLAQLLAAGTLEVHIEQTFQLDQAAEAMHALRTEHRRGKLAIRV